MKNLHSTIFLTILLTGCSEQAVDYEKKVILERCIEKNKQNILNLSIPTPLSFYDLQVKTTKMMEEKLLKKYPNADIKTINTYTIKEMVEMLGLNNEENLNMFKQVPYLSDDEIEKNDKLLMLTLFDFYKGVLLQYPELLERNAEEICNYQGIY